MVHPHKVLTQPLRQRKEALTNRTHEKLAFCPTGCELFDALCLRMDVNQKYEFVLPQWRDLAGRLEIDELRTRWIEACVRPAEGMTRCMLEFYMKDGGTLGEVLQALLDLECLDILESLKGKHET